MQFSLPLRTSVVYFFRNALERRFVGRLHVHKSPCVCVTLYVMSARRLGLSTVVNRADTRSTASIFSHLVFPPFRPNFTIYCVLQHFYYNMQISSVRIRLHYAPRCQSGTSQTDFISLKAQRVQYPGACPVPALWVYDAFRRHSFVGDFRVTVRQIPRGLPRRKLFSCPVFWAVQCAKS